MALSGATAANKLAQKKSRKNLQCLNGPQWHDCKLAYMLATTNPEKLKPQPKQQPQTATETKATTKDMRLNQEE